MLFVLLAAHGGSRFFAGVSRCPLGPSVAGSHAAVGSVRPVRTLINLYDFGQVVVFGLRPSCTIKIQQMFIKHTK